MAARDDKKEPMLFRPIKTKRAFEEISAEIKRLIFSGVLKAGNRLPSETELAGQFGVSRHTVREALRRLEIAGFIATRKGGVGGPLVVDTILDTISNSFLDAFRLKRMTHGDLTQARLEVEKMVLKAAFGRITGRDLDLMRECIRESRSRLERKLPTFEADIHFHRLIAQATGNYVFDMIMESLMAVVAHFHSFNRIGLKTSAETAIAHEGILSALEAQDRAAALDLLERHILDVDASYRSLGTRGRKGEKKPAEGAAPK